MKKTFFLLAIISTLFSEAQLPKQFKPEDQPAAPDYSNPKSWLTLPFRKDGADVIPKSETWINDSLKNVDVFYIYPTLYSKGKTWCADIQDEKLNKRLTNLPVKFQATVFNRVGRIYTPLYRQGNIKCFTDGTGNGTLALDFAYQDVKRAFEYYLKNYHHGRSIIIVSHSQGTRHARQLLKEYFDTPSMKEKLICAYIVGYGIYPSAYKLLKPCDNAAETNCYVTWASFKNNFNADHDTLLYGRVCVNPLSWKRDTTTVSAKAGILLSLNKKKPFYTEAKMNGNYLWVKTKTPVVQNWKVMHLVDFNLYWFEIRKNVALRVAEYFKTRNR